MTTDILRKILDHSDLQSKCIYLICATSGSRISSVLNLKRKNIDLNHKFPYITFYSTYNKNKIIRFKIMFIEIFFKISFKPNDFIFPALKRKSGKPMIRQNVGHKFRLSLQKAKIEEINDNTKQRTIVVHSLKHFFKSNFKCSEPEFKSYLADHPTPRDKEYWNKPLESLEKLYEEGYKNLLVYEKPYDEDEVNKLKEKLKNTEQSLENLTRLTKDTRKRMSLLENLSNEINDKYNESDDFRTSFNLGGEMSCNSIKDEDERQFFKDIMPLISDELFNQAKRKNKTVFEILDNFDIPDNKIEKVLKNKKQANQNK
jgi:hypothetical protein